MKKIIKPAEKEESVYYSDFTGKCFGELFPEVQVKVSFNYGSKYDDGAFQLDLTDEEFDSIFTIIKQNLSADYKQKIKKQIREHQELFKINADNRELTACSSVSNLIEFLKSMVD